MEPLLLKLQGSYLELQQIAAHENLKKTNEICSGLSSKSKKSASNAECHMDSKGEGANPVGFTIATSKISTPNKGSKTEQIKYFLNCGT